MPTNELNKEVRIPRIGFAIFGNISNKSEHSGLNYRNYMLVAKANKDLNVTNVACLSAETRVEGVNFLVFEGSWQAKSFSIMKKLARLLGLREGRYYSERLLHELHFDLFCLCRLNRDLDAVVDVKGLSPLLRLACRSSSTPFFHLVATRPLAEESRAILSYCKRRNLKEKTPYINITRNWIWKKFISSTDLVIPIIPSRKAFCSYKQNFPELNISAPTSMYEAHPVFTPPAPPNDENNKSYTFLCFSGGTHKKGIQILIDAWKMIDTGKSILKIVGQEEEFDSSSISHNIQFIQYTKQVHEYYHTSDVFVCPTLIDLGPRSAFEAMAAGLITIVSSEAGASEWITPENGIVFEANNTLSLANALRLVIDQTQPFKKRTDRIKWAKNTFNSEKYTQEICNIICDHTKRHINNNGGI